MVEKPVTVALITAIGGIIVAVIGTLGGYRIGLGQAYRMGEMAVGLDYPGNDLGNSFDVNSTWPNECRDQCEVTEECDAWVFTINLNGPTASCQLKSPKPNAVRNSATIAGIRDRDD